MPDTKIKAVPSAAPDYTRCRAAVLSSRADAPVQCSRQPLEIRQGSDGTLYRVCAQHKRARFFLPWSHQLLISQLDACRAFDRIILGLRGDKPPTLKLVR